MVTEITKFFYINREAPGERIGGLGVEAVLQGETIT